jgi:hypothetical protein
MVSERIRSMTASSSVLTCERGSPNLVVTLVIFMMWLFSCKSTLSDGKDTKKTIHFQAFWQLFEPFRAKR